MSDGPAFSIPEFCSRNTISRATFYNLAKEGRGPRLMRITPNRIAITPDAESEWRKAREADAAAEGETENRRVRSNRGD